MKLNKLFLCLLPTLWAIPAMAGNVTVNPGDDVAKAITNAKSGDTVTFAAGTFNISSPITIPSGVILLGNNGNAYSADPAQVSHVVFKLDGGDTASYGFVLPAGANGNTIKGLDITSNLGILSMADASGGSYSNITIRDNNLQYGAGSLSDGTLVFGIFGTIHNVNTQIVYNKFHDSPNTIRSYSIWFAENSYFDNNLYVNVTDGGQLDNPIGTVDFSSNYGTQLHRMGQECALSALTTKFNCSNNTFYNYLTPYYDTEGVSIIGVAQEVDITNNYFSATIDPSSSYGIPDGGGKQRFGYAIECTGNPSNVTGNTLIGPWADDVSSDIANANVSGNKVFGVALWGAFDGEPGPFGYGSVTTAKNTIDNNAGDAPAPVANNWAGPEYDNGATFANGTSSSATTNNANGGNANNGGGSGSTGTSGGGGSTTSGSSGTSSGTVPPNYPAITQSGTLPITGVVVNVTSSTTATISWTSPNPDVTGVQINIISTIGRQNFPTVYTTGNVTTMNLTSLHPGWLIDFTVEAIGSNGQEYISKPVTASFPGNSVAPWQGLLWGGISALQTDPYVQN